jgi:hypothetical protein
MSADFNVNEGPETPSYLRPGGGGTNQNWRQDIPAEVMQVLDKQAEDAPWTCLVRRTNSRGAGTTQLREYERYIPNDDELAYWYGVGNYTKSLRIPGLKPPVPPIHVRLEGTHYESLARQGADDRDAEEAQRLEKREQQIAMQRRYGNPVTTEPRQPERDPIDSLEKTLGVIGPFIGAGQKQQGGGDLSALASIMQSSNQMMMTMMQESNKMMMGIMGPLLVGLMNKNQGNQGEDMLMNRMFGMTEKLLHLQASLSPKEQSTVDKIFEFLAKAGESLLPVMAQSMEARRADPRVQMAATMGADWITTLKQSPAAVNELAARLSTKFDPESVARVLETFDIPAPPGMRSSPEQPAPGGEDAEYVEEQTGMP